MEVRFKKLSNDIPDPQYHTDGSVAFDFMANEDAVINPQETVFISTGLIIATPPGYALVVAARSSLPRKKGLSLPHGIGIIDQDYCGPEDECKLLLVNTTNEPVEIKRGERLCQGMFVHTEKAEFIHDEDLSNPSRGGFGSTEGYHK